MPITPDLDDLPIDVDLEGERQLMPDADLEPSAVEGDRFDAGNDDLGHAPELESDAEPQDVTPTTVERFAAAEALGEPTLEDVEDDLTARPRDHVPDQSH
jgi:hypothetical protein